jgi:hypothetical protein
VNGNTEKEWTGDKNCRDNKQWNWVSEKTEHTGDNGDVMTFLMHRYRY